MINDLFYIYIAVLNKIFFFSEFSSFLLTGPEKSSTRTEILAEIKSFSQKNGQRRKFVEKFSWNSTSSLISRLTSIFAICSY